MEPTFLYFHLTETEKDHWLLSTAGEDPLTSHNLHDVSETQLLCWYQSVTEVPTPTQPSRMSKWDIMVSAISPWDLLLETFYPNSSCFSITAMLNRKVNRSLLGIPQAELLWTQNCNSQVACWHQAQIKAQTLWAINSQFQSDMSGKLYSVC